MVSTVSKVKKQRKLKRKQILGWTVTRCCVCGCAVVTRNGMPRKYPDYCQHHAPNRWQKY